MMMDYGWGIMGGFGFIWMLLFWGILITLAIWLVGRLFPTARVGSGENPSAREILKRRYARGELTEEQYQQMLQTIEQ